MKLDRGATLDADMAFLDSQDRGETKAQSVRAAIKAYLVTTERVTKATGTPDGLRGPGDAS